MYMQLKRYHTTLGVLCQDFFVQLRLVGMISNLLCDVLACIVKG